MLRLLAGAVVLYGVLCLVALLVADRMIFLPPPATYRDGAEIVKLFTEDGVRISATYLPHPSEATRVAEDSLAAPVVRASAPYTLLVSHGNAEDLGDIRPHLVRLRAMGFSVLAYDYRGYGTSEGQPSERGTYADVDAAYAYLTRDLGVPPARIIAYGRSVGSGPAVDLAAREPIGGLVVESAFTTAFRVLTRVTLFPFDKFDNLDKIARVRCPVLVMHGRADEIVPFGHGETLWRAAPEPKRFFWAERAGHNDFWLVDEPGATRALIEFVALLPASP
jgi:fermentation-respiration switch protein FrsA (DUF1100 family)